MTPAVIVFFIGSYLTGIFETPAAYQPLWWIGCYLRVRRAQLLGRRAVVQDLGGRHAAGARRCWSCSGSARSRIADFTRWALNIAVGPDGALIELPERRRCVPAEGLERRARGAAVRGVAVPRDRRAAARRRGIGRSEEGHAEGPDLRHVHADRLGADDHVAERLDRLAGGRQAARLVLAGDLGRAAARRLPRHLRRRHREAAVAVRGDRTDRELPHDHLRVRPADLFAVARRLLPGA